MEKTFKYFSEKGYKHYTENTIEELDELPLNNQHIITEFAHLCEWLRVNHGIHVEVGFDAWNKETYSFSICIKGRKDYHYDDVVQYNSPQEAYLAAFNYIKKMV